jgi:alpha-L-fucosidase
VERWTGSGWAPLARGTTIGHKRLHRLSSAATTMRVRLRIESTLGPTRISRIALHDGRS